MIYNYSTYILEMLDFEKIGIETISSTSTRKPQIIRNNDEYIVSSEWSEENLVVKSTITRFGKVFYFDVTYNDRYPQRFAISCDDDRSPKDIYIEFHKLLERYILKILLFDEELRKSIYDTQNQTNEF